MAYSKYPHPDFVYSLSCLIILNKLNYNTLYPHLLNAGTKEDLITVYIFILLAL